MQALIGMKPNPAVNTSFVQCACSTGGYKLAKVGAGLPRSRYPTKISMQPAATKCNPINLFYELWREIHYFYLINRYETIK